MNNLESALQAIASTFAEQIIAAVRASSIDELTGVAAPTKQVTRPSQAPKALDGRRARRSATDIAEMTEAIVGLLKDSPEGLSAEQIRAALGIQKAHWAKPIGVALESGTVTKTGEKRGTRYTAAGVRKAGPGSGGLKKKASAKKR